MEHERRKVAASDGASCDLHFPVVAKPALSESIQDYLKAIYKLQDESGKVTVSGLARGLSVSPASASAMVKKLAALDPWLNGSLTAASR